MPGFRRLPSAVSGFPARPTGFVVAAVVVLSGVASAVVVLRVVVVGRLVLGFLEVLLQLLLGLAAAPRQFLEVAGGHGPGGDAAGGAGRGRTVVALRRLCLIRWRLSLLRVPRLRPVRGRMLRTGTFRAAGNGIVGLVGGHHWMLSPAAAHRLGTKDRAPASARRQ